MKYFLILAALFCAMQSSAQRDYYTEGDALIQSGQFAQAEELYREALKAEPANNDYASQIGVCLLQQNKLAEAETVLNDVLKKDATNFVAMWYVGVVRYSSKNYASAVVAFENVLPMLDKSSAQYPSAFWFIGKSYSSLLKTTGITSKEADRMFECYDQYLTLQPTAQDANKIQGYVTAAKQNRPALIKDKWIAQ